MILTKIFSFLFLIIDIVKQYLWSITRIFTKDEKLKFEGDLLFNEEKELVGSGTLYDDLQNPIFCGKVSLNKDLEFETGDGTSTINEFIELRTETHETTKIKTYYFRQKKIAESKLKSRGNPKFSMLHSLIPSIDAESKIFNSLLLQMTQLLSKFEKLAQTFFY